MRLTYCFVAICLMLIICYANADDELPEFKVKVETKNAIAIKESEVLQVVVTANKSDGTPIDGKVLIDLSVKFHYRYIVMGNLANGRAKFEFVITKSLIQTSSDDKSEVLQMLVIVEEYSTGATVLSNAETIVYYNCCNLDKCVDSSTCDFYEADKEQDVFYQITHKDGSYLNDTKSTVELTYREILQRDHFLPQLDGVAEPKHQNLILTFTGHMNETGCVKFKVKLPKLLQQEGYLHYYGSKLKFLNQETEYRTVSQKNLT